ncbi:MAG TPA: hypothetical protein VLA12_15695 [Planctomycetaceae bacterium]|nr:hypothetical protein [Planctomycetaceae bacterium]
MSDFFQLEGGGLWINLSNVVSVTFNDPGYTILLDTGSKYEVKAIDIEHFEKALKKFNYKLS